MQQVPSKIDNVMLQKQCKNIDKFLSDDKYDAAMIEQMLVDEFGLAEVTRATDTLSRRFERRADTLREYTTQLEVRIAELSHMIA